jgi:hypothetical protein
LSRRTREINSRGFNIAARVPAGIRHPATPESRPIFWVKIQGQLQFVAELHYPEGTIDSLIQVYTSLEKLEPNRVA